MLIKVVILGLLFRHYTQECASTADFFAKVLQVLEAKSVDQKIGQLFKVATVSDLSLNLQVLS